MNKTVSLRDDVLAAIDSIDNVVTESEIDVLVSMLGATDKAVSIMENYSGDELGSFGIFMEDGENNSGNEKKDESVLKSIVMLPIRLLQSLWKLITGQFNKESVETTKAAAMKVEDVEPGIFNGLLDFFKRDDGSTNGVKVGGVVLTAAAVAALATYKTKFKTAESNATGAISTALSKLPRSSSSYSGLNANDMKFDIKGENDNKTIETNISLDGCVGFIDAVTPYINNFNNLNGTRAEAVAKIDKTYESAILTKKTNTYAFGDFANRLGEIQTKCADLTKGDKLKNVENAIARGDNTGNGRNGVAEDNRAVAQKFGEMAGVLLAMVTMLNTINAQHREISDAITQGAQQVQQAQQDQQNNNNQNGQQTGSNNSQNGQTEPGQNLASGDLYTMVGSGKNEKFKLNQHGSTTDRNVVMRLINHLRTEYTASQNDNINILDSSGNVVKDIKINKLTDWAKFITQDSKDFTLHLDGNSWVAYDLNLKGLQQNQSKPKMLSPTDALNIIDYNAMGRPSASIHGDGPNNILRDSNSSPVDEITDKDGDKYKWDNGQKNYKLQQKQTPPPAPGTTLFTKGQKYTAGEIIDVLENQATPKGQFVGTFLNGTNWGAMRLSDRKISRLPATSDMINKFNLNKDAGVLISSKDNNVTAAPHAEVDFSNIAKTLGGGLAKGKFKLVKNATPGDAMYVFECADDETNDSDELVQEEFEVDPVASTWYSK